MTPEQFIYWLQGYTAALEAPEDWRMAAIRKRLAEVELGRTFKPNDRGVQPVISWPYPLTGGLAKAGPDHAIQNAEPSPRLQDAIDAIEACAAKVRKEVGVNPDDFEGAPV